MSTGTTLMPAQRIGPNAVTQLLAALGESTLSPAPIFAAAGLDSWLGTPPDQMVDEQKVARLHQTVRAQLPPDQAAALLARAGRLTADYLLRARIPRPAQWLLAVLPARLAARLLLRAIAAHAWTFAGSGRFSGGLAEDGIVITILANPLCAGERADRPVCVWHRAVLQRLFETLVSPRVGVEETHCGAQGGELCRFQIRWR